MQPARDESSPATPEPQAPVHDIAASDPFIEVGGMTDAGGREANCECFITADLRRSLVIGPSSTVLAEGTPWFGGTQGKLIVVADGIAGAGAGEHASNVAVRALAWYVAGVMSWVADKGVDEDDELFKDELTGALRRCQARVRAEAKRRGFEDFPAGTTMTIAYISWPTLHVVHVGDSRVYLLRDGRLLQLTSDDTIAQRLVEREIAPPEEAENTPFSDVLVNAVGGDDDQIDIEFHRLELEYGDQVLVCSDGVARTLEPHDITQHLVHSALASTACRRLVTAASAEGEPQNVTAVVARVERGREQV